MPSSSARRRSRLPLPAWGVLALLSACGGSGTGPDGAGTLEVRVSTTGEDPDPDGYTLSLDGAEEREVASSETVTFTGVASGDHALELAGVALNCRVDPTTRSVRVAAGERAVASFDVACSRLGRIAFVSDRTGNFEIWSVRLDGSELSNLTGSDARDTGPVWSPDGTKIAFHTDRPPSGPVMEPQNEIWVMNSNGGNPRNLSADPAGDGGARWSPDGSRIAFVSTRSGSSDIWIMDADGSNQVNLTNHPAGDGGHAWSPDGSRLAFTSFRSGNLDIWMMDADGSNPVQLTDHPDDDRPVLWSVDGTQLLFGTWRAPDYVEAIWLMNADGSNPVSLTAGTGDAQSPQWSPDGTQVLFVSTRTGFWDVWVMAADGSGQTNLTPEDGHALRAAYSPDGTLIAFEKDLDIWVMRADGSDRVNLTNHPGQDLSARWQP